MGGTMSGGTVLVNGGQAGKGEGVDAGGETTVDEVTSKMEECKMVAVKGNKECDNHAGSSSDSEDEFEIPLLNEDLRCLIDNLKGKGRPDSKLLLKAVMAIKAYLKDEKNKRSVDSLVNHEGFLEFFVRCLKDGSNNTSLQFNSAWIFERIITRGDRTTVRTIVDAETVAVPMLLKCLQSADKTTYEKTLSVIAHLAKIEPCQPQLMSNATSLFIPLAKFLQGKNPSKQLMIDTDIILEELFMSRIKARKAREEKLIEIGEDSDKMFIRSSDIDDCMPSARFVKLALPVIAALMSLDNGTTDITRHMLEYLVVTANVLEDVMPVVESGCCAKIVACFASDDKNILIPAMTFLGLVASMGPDHVFTFLKALKGIGGLGHYWKCFQLVESEKPTTTGKLVGNFLVQVAHIVHCNIQGEGIEAAIYSGMIDCLVHSVQDLKDHSVFRNESLCILQCFLCQQPPERRAVVTGILPSVLENLKEHFTCGLADKCIMIVQKLTEENCERRDKAIALGGVDVLLDFLKSVSPLTAGAALNCIHLLLQGKPKAGLEHFVHVPLAMKRFMESQFQNCTQDFIVKDVETVLAIVGEIAAYGHDGIDLVIEAGLHFKIQALLTFDNRSKIPYYGMIALQHICTIGTMEHRKELLRIGVLTEFETVLESYCDATRKMGLTCLQEFMNKTKSKLTAEDRKAIKKLGKVVKAELSRNVLGTQGLAKAISEKISKMK